MRRKIQDLIRGDFEYDRPALLFEEEELHFSVIEEEDYNGSFRMKSSDKKPIRGIVTCENPNIRVETTEFDGISLEIRFTFLGSRVTEGEEETGCFVITSSSGEYLLPYVAKITRHYLPTSIGKIKTLNDFVNLASLNWDEALKIFSSPHFTNIFHENAEFYSLLYHGLTQSRYGSHEMEEFLIGVGKKKRNHFSVDEAELKFAAKEQPLTKILQVRKTEWGFVQIHVTCDAPFVNLPKGNISSYDFVGKHAELPVQILPRMMHSGKNYALLKLSNSFQCQTILITATKGEEHPVHTIAWQRRQIDAQMERAYISYRLGELDGQEWKKETQALLAEAKMLTPDDKWLGLYLAYLFVTAGELDNAEDALLNVPRNMRNGRTPFGAFCQYITCLKNGEITEEFKAKLREIHLKHRHHPMVNWLYVQTDASLERNPTRKYQALRQILTEESKSPIFYLEAALLLKKHPEVLGSRDAFDFRMAGWLAKHDLLTKELSIRIQNLAQERNAFSRSYLRVLSKCYKQFGDEGIVRTVCGYLIHAGRYGEGFFPWFRRGVEQKLKIAGLYEAFLLSWSRSQGELPKEVVRYFSMNSSLPAGKKAMLFAYIVRNRKRLSKDWESYMVIVKNFALKELEKEHMSDDLAIIYDELRREMDASEWMSVRKDADFSYKIHTTGENVSAVRVLQLVPENKKGVSGNGSPSGIKSGVADRFSKNLATGRDAGASKRDPISGQLPAEKHLSDTFQKRVPLVGGQAFIHLYRRPFVILYEDASGNLYTTKDCCRMSKMLPGNNIYSTHPQDIPSDSEVGRMQSRKNAGRLEGMEGSIDEMTELLLALPPRAKNRISCAQQIMIRMLFTGYLGERHGEVFQILSGDAESEPILLAYMTILSRSLLMRDYPLAEEVYEFMGKRLQDKKNLNAWCEAAFLRMYLERTSRNGRFAEPRMNSEYTEHIAERIASEGVPGDVSAEEKRERAVAKEPFEKCSAKNGFGSVSAGKYKDEADAILSKNLFDGNYFDFYRLLPESVRRKWLLMGLSVVTAFDEPGKTLYLSLAGGRETMREVLPGIYTYPMRLFEGESVSYKVTDVTGNVESSGRVEYGFYENMGDSSHNVAKNSAKVGDSSNSIEKDSAKVGDSSNSIAKDSAKVGDSSNGIAKDSAKVENGLYNTAEDSATDELAARDATNVSSKAEDKTRFGMVAALCNGELDTKAQYAYAELSDLADALFVPIRE